MKLLHYVAGIPITLIVTAIAGIALNAGFAMAQSEATSTSEATTTAEVVDPAASSTPSKLPALVSHQPVVSETPLKMARAIGTKYIDYCTDGTKTIEVPGDPEISANLGRPDAPTPKCPDGTTWDHTSGVDAYDTPSGELEVGSYAQQADGSYIVRYPAKIFTDATSTALWPERIVVTKAAPITQEPAPVANEPATGSASSPTDASSTAATSTQ